MAGGFVACREHPAPIPATRIRRKKALPELMLPLGSYNSPSIHATTERMNRCVQICIAGARSGHRGYGEHNAQSRRLRRGFRPNAAAVKCNDAAANGKSQAAATLFRVRGGGKSKKTLEDSFT